MSSEWVVLTCVCLGWWMMERQVITTECLPILGWKQRSSLGMEDFAMQSIFPKGDACKIQMLIPTLTFVAGASNYTGTFVQTKRRAKKWNDIFLPSSLLSMACSLSYKKLKCQRKLQCSFSSKHAFSLIVKRSIMFNVVSEEDGLEDHFFHSHSGL